MSCNEWREVRLDEIGEIITGKTPPTKNQDNFGDEFLFITPRDMKGQKYIFSTERKLSEKGKNYVKTCLVPPNSICVSCIGSDMGKVVMTTKPSITNQQINSIIVNRNTAYEHFVYYALINISKELRNVAFHSTAIPILNKSSFSRFTITLPPLNEQKAIAKILSDLDEKIEINSRTNKVLEEIAQAIFKRWFIDFEFPNENGEPYKSSGGEFVDSELGPIPKGWEVVRLGEYISFIKGKKPKDIIENNIEGYMDYLTIDVLNNNSRLFAEPEKMIIVENKNNMMVMDGASSGTIYFGFKGIVASTLAKIEVINNKINDDVLFFILKYYENDIKNHTTGSAIPHADKEYIKRLPVALPKDNELIQQYSRLSGNIRSQIFMIIKENQNLSQLRDTLLPKLMSGEIRTQ